MKRLRRLCVTAAATAGLVALAGCGFRGVDSIPLPGGPDLGDDPIEVKIEFANVLDLVPQSVVKLNDVSVGKVTKVDLARGTGAGSGQSWLALVHVKMRRDVNLPDNTGATISQTSLLGEKFVALTPPKDEAPQGKLGDGADLIPLARTTRSTEIEEVLSALSMLLNGGGIEQVSTITKELNAAMSGRESTIKSVLHRVDTFVGTLDTHRGAIVRAIDSIDRLTGKLAAERATIADTIDKAGPAVDILNRNRADLTKMLVSLDKLSRTTTRVINASKADTLANLKSLDTTLRNLNKAGADLPNALETMLTFPFPATFANVLKGDYGNLRMTLDLDINNLTKNLLGGTDLEPMARAGDQMRLLLKPPSLSLPDTPLGVLPEFPEPNAAPNPGQTPQPTPSRKGEPGKGKPSTGTPSTGRPRALGPVDGQSDLYTLLSGGTS